ncbi:hypothetical protein [Streptomyces sp. NPDC006132]|uniref:hypothetical protein n=1 Tax=Streptomyces sp. NPDC006132 TaxID=3156732 RepID=UPI0033F4B73E
MSLNDIRKFRETIAARAEAKGFPGLLPCALGADCRAYESAARFSEKGTPLHAESSTEVVELREVLRRANVRIAADEKARFTIVCRACTQWFHQREMWRDI